MTKPKELAVDQLLTNISEAVKRSPLAKLLEALRDSFNSAETRNFIQALVEGAEALQTYVNSPDFKEFQAWMETQPDAEECSLSEMQDRWDALKKANP